MAHKTCDRCRWKDRKDWGRCGDFVEVTYDEMRGTEVFLMADHCSIGPAPLSMLQQILDECSFRDEVKIRLWDLLRARRMLFRVTTGMTTYGTRSVMFWQDNERLAFLGGDTHDGLLELVEGLSEADWIGRCKFSCDGALLYEIAQDWVKNERAKIELEKIRP